MLIAKKHNRKRRGETGKVRSTIRISQEEHDELEKLLQSLLDEHNIKSSMNEILRVSLKEFFQKDRKQQINEIYDHRFNYWSVAPRKSKRK